LAYKREVVDLGSLPGGSHSYAEWANVHREVVGSAIDSNGVERAFVYRRGMMIGLDDRGAVGSSATCINDSGIVVGCATFREASTGKTQIRAVMWINGRMICLDEIVPRLQRWELTIAEQVNNQGAIAVVATGGRQQTWILLEPEGVTE
jgi:uncharacterized membrane protein